MKGLIKNYIDLLSKEKLNEFGIKNGINLNDTELEYLLNLVKTNWEDMLVNENKYLELLKVKINQKDFIKIKDLFYHYKNKYKGYLF